ncbi:IS66 family transposase [Janthinobacterium sp. J1-1]|uniref:IS66 family transposase n=1 Tax=unclassified Janthinobacterium TaxID=2610881 RepID=UPI002810D40D|nr:transposase [Janthinobacterium sp. J1-1]
MNASAATARLLHSDESVLRVAGKLHCLHVAANDSHTWYDVPAKRGMEAITAQVILPQRLGVLIHNCWAPYWQLAGPHALCNAYCCASCFMLKRSPASAGPSG